MQEHMSGLRQLIKELGHNSKILSSVGLRYENNAFNQLRTAFRAMEQDRKINRIDLDFIISALSFDNKACLGKKHDWWLGLCHWVEEASDGWMYIADFVFLTYGKVTIRLRFRRSANARQVANRTRWREHAVMEATWPCYKDLLKFASLELSGEFEVDSWVTVHGRLVIFSTPWGGGTEWLFDEAKTMRLVEESLRFNALKIKYENSVYIDTAPSKCPLKLTAIAGLMRRVRGRILLKPLNC